MISEDKPVVVDWTSAPRGDRRAGAAFELTHTESLGAIEDALGDGTRILAHARIRVTEAAGDDAGAPDGGTPAAGSHVTGSVGCVNGVLHVFIGVEDDATMTSTLLHDISTSIACR
ncbi:hypothetical protein [Actinoplanes sp. RD1]|uniref:hypothetical protein n=1 Tax=Actinoplanes sp. RD1 TaxID=3064538 RepID=UPI0027423AEF|nr:hypothetical protein [Actinoplanes sp. RD1]